jgi:pyruvate dehydrogenase E2 component (dihydrolipoamide acetyltransferase)
MAEQVLMLALSPTMEEGTVATWKKKEGDKISQGDVICEVETDKATMDYESVQEGVLLKILVPEGGDAAVGLPIAIIGEEGEDISDLEKETAEAADKSGEKEEAAEDASPATSEKKTEEKKQVPESKPEKDETPSRNRTVEQDTTSSTDDGWVKASPLAREIARQRGIDISAVKGSGPGGRIVKKDVESAPARIGRPAGAAFTQAQTAGEDRVVKVSKMRKAISGRLTESKFSAPHFYLNLSVRGEALMEARKGINAALPEKISVNAFIIKLAAEALKRHSRVNASWEGDTIREFGSVDIGLAVALEDGLITPVVRNCGSKGIVEIDGELKELIPRAQEGKLAPEEYTGAGFSISNLGSFGIEEFTAIINPPSSAILAVGALNKTPVVEADGSLGAGLVMKFTLSCDHRVIDGAEGARFMTTLKNNFENPMSALL